MYSISKRQQHNAGADTWRDKDKKQLGCYNQTDEYILLYGTNGPVAPVAQRYHETSDTLGREFGPGKRDFSH